MEIPILVDPKKFQCFPKSEKQSLLIFFFIFHNFLPSLFHFLQHFPFFFYLYSLPRFSRLLTKNFPVVSLWGGTLPPPLTCYATGHDPLTKTLVIKPLALPIGILNVNNRKTFFHIFFSNSKYCCNIWIHLENCICNHVKNVILKLVHTEPIASMSSINMMAKLKHVIVGLYLWNLLTKCLLSFHFHASSWLVKKFLVWL